MNSSAKAFVMLAVLVGGPAAYIHFGPLPPEAMRYVDQALGAAKGMLSRGATPGEPSSYHADSPDYVPFDSLQAPTTAGEMQAGLASCPGGICPASPPTPAPPAGDLQPLLDQLVKLGVGEYELTRWGAAGDFYRFRCVAPLAGSMDQTQQFEAVGPTPLASVEQVLGEVSSWRVARGAGPLVR